MSHPGHKLIKSRTGNQTVKRCICKGIECRELSRCFMSLGDARGDFTMIPIQNSHPVKEFKLRRIVQHLGMYPDDRAMILSGIGKSDGGGQGHDNKDDDNEEEDEEDDDNNDDDGEENDDNDNNDTPNKKSKNTKKRKSRNSTAYPKSRKSFYIAYHHFHPQVIEEIAVSRGKKSVDLIEENKIKSWGLYGKGYTDDDLYPHPLPKKGRFLDISDLFNTERFFAPVPTYKEARQDYIQVLHDYRMEGLIAMCREQVDATTASLTEDGMDGDILPLDKLPKVNNILNLKTAVSILAAEREKLRGTIRDLKEKINE
mmetsp:Transcript_8557/g.15986  ORF Transcript_8557/g.15986 Transcript_8557/m.15986 type:complete len:314 (+) Transcript_8557:138-1079(+)